MKARHSDIPRESEQDAIARIIAAAKAGPIQNDVKPGTIAAIIKAAPRTSEEFLQELQASTMTAKAKALSRREPVHPTGPQIKARAEKDRCGELEAHRKLFRELNP